MPSLDLETLERRVRRLPRFSDATCLPGWKSERIGKSAGNGTVGIFRVSGEANTGVGRERWSVVCKVLDERVGGMGGEFNSPAVELAAYESGLFEKPAGHVGFRAAAFYGIDVRDDGSRCLWLEDLSGSPMPPWPGPLYVSAARHVGQFNGEWAVRPPPPHDWIARGNWRHGALAASAESWDRLRSLKDDPLIRSAYSDDVIDRSLGVGPQIGRITAAVVRLPMSLGHSDCHPKNLFPVLIDGDHSATVAVDWASVGLGPLGMDAGPLLGSGLIWTELTASQAEPIERKVFDSYFLGLRDSGWRGSRDAVRLAYLASLAADYGGRMVLFTTRVVDDPEFKAWGTRIVGKPAEEILGQWEQSLRFMFPLLDEAVDLADTL